MTVLAIVQIGDPVLRARAAEVAPDALASDAVQTLIDDMVATMRAAPGVGLAAPQIGRALRIIVAEDPDAAVGRLSEAERHDRGRDAFPLHVMINPELRPAGPEHAVFPEGCLSIPGYAALVERSLAVEATWLDRHGVRQGWTRFAGWPARILQHEVDHLDGVLYTDRMIARSFMTDAHLRTRSAGRPIAALLDGIGG